MKCRPIFCFLAGAVALSLTSCKSGGEGPEPAPAPTVRSPAPTFSTAPEPTSAPAVENRDIPRGSYAPWQTAYAEFLTKTVAAEAPLMSWAETATEADITTQPEKWSAANDVSDGYSLYDVDKDGVPELFIRYGVASAGHHTLCYTFREEKVEEIGEFTSGHSSLYTVPEENALIQHWGHMGYAAMERYTVQEGKLVFVERFFEEDATGQDRGYTQPGELVPGSEYLPEYNTRLTRGEGGSEALTLPVYDYGALPRLLEAPLEETEVRKAIGKVLEGNGELWGCSGDGFYGAVGQATLKEYLMKAYPYSSLTAAAVAWPDVNGDGQTDCVLRLEGKEGDNALTFYTVLNLQEDTVYAYFFGFMDALGVDPDGSVYFREFDRWYQISFYQSQCYGFPVLQDPVEGCDPAWDEVSPAP